MNSELSELLGILAIADLIGLTAGTVQQMRTHGELPPPDVEIGHFKLWKKSTITEWDSARVKRYDNRKRQP